MKFRYEDLEVWNAASKLYVSSLPILEKLPPSEHFGLQEQIRRALLSVVLNIAEGSGRATEADFKRFVRQAIGSLVEADAGLKLAMNARYLAREDYEKIDPLVESVYYKLIGLEKSLKRRLLKKRMMIQRFQRGHPE